MSQEPDSSFPATPRVGLLDPSIGQGGPWDVNLGDQLIVESVQEILEKVCGFRIGPRVSTLRKIEPRDRDLLRKCDLIIVAGTNLLSSNMNEYRQWVISLWDTFYLKNIVLLGVGWWQYQDAPNTYTGFLLRRILSKTKYHSVRDDYTKRQLGMVGIHNVLNTTCPTLWGLTPELQTRIPPQKAGAVLTTLTCYNQDPASDTKLLELLYRSYSKVYLWPQGDGDREYAESLIAGLRWVPSDVPSLDNFLMENDDIDYVGTRLHAGIRAIQKGKRTLILGIDNRAAEISKDVNLTVIERTDVTAIKRWIYSDHTTDIRLPTEAIKAWVNQFR